jgi:hypothetical protein
VVGALVAALCALPALAGARPAGSTDLDADQLRALVLRSTDVGWSGYAESRGSLALPDVRELGDVAGLLGGTTRTRVWWRDRDDWRVDRLSLVGETDQVRAGTLSITWDSADRRADLLLGTLPLRLPQPVDLVAPVLGRRLAATPQVALERLPARRVAGRTTGGLRLVPAAGVETTVRAIDLWVDPATGLALRVEVTAQGRQEPALTSVVLDLDASAPPPERVTIDIPAQARRVVGEVPDVAAAIERFAPYRLPRTLAGRDRSDLSDLGTDAGVGTYGAGLAAFAVVPLPGDIGRRIERSLDDGSFTSPLVNARIGVDGGRSYLLVGTVPADVLASALDALLANPPPELGQ